MFVFIFLAFAANHTNQEKSKYLPRNCEKHFYRNHIIDRNASQEGMMIVCSSWLLDYNLPICNLDSCPLNVTQINKVFFKLQNRSVFDRSFKFLDAIVFFNKLLPNKFELYFSNLKGFDISISDSYQNDYLNSKIST